MIRRIKATIAAPLKKKSSFLCFIVFHLQCKFKDIVSGGKIIDPRHTTNDVQLTTQGKSDYFLVCILRLKP